MTYNVRVVTSVSRNLLGLAIEAAKHGTKRGEGDPCQYCTNILAASTHCSSTIRSMLLGSRNYEISDTILSQAK